MLTQNYWLLALDATAFMPVLDFAAEGQTQLSMGKH